MQEDKIVTRPEVFTVACDIKGDTEWCSSHFNRLCDGVDWVKGQDWFTETDLQITRLRTRLAKFNDLVRNCRRGRDMSPKPTEPVILAPDDALAHMSSLLAEARMLCVPESQPQTTYQAWHTELFDIHHKVRVLKADIHAAVSSILNHRRQIA
jgi:hypothetical protein